MAIEHTPARRRRHRRFNWHGHRDPFRGFRDELGEVFGEYDPTSNGRPGPDVVAVSLDAAETDEAYEITLDLPGVEKDQIDVSFDNGRLTITGERKREDNEGKSFHRVGR